MKPVVAKLSAVVSLAPYATAALFTSAALLKVHYLRNYPITEDGFFHSRNFTICLLELELLVSALLIYPRTRRPAVMISIAMLTVFIIYSLNLWTQGVEICGCLGVLSTSPKIMASIDSGLLVFLFMKFTRFKTRSRSSIASGLTAKIARPSIVVSVVPAIMVTAFGYSRQQIQSLVMPLGIEVRPDIVDLGEITEHDKKSGQFTIVNHRPYKISIASIIPDCSCTTTKLTKSELGPEEEATVGVSLRAGSIISQMRRALRVNISSSRRNEEFPVIVRAKVVLSANIVVFPNEIDFGEVLAGQAVQKLVYIRGPSDALAGLPDEVDLGSGDAEAIVHMRATGSNAQLITKTLRLTLKPAYSEAPLKIATNLRLIDQSRESGSQASLPIRAKLTPDFRISPSNILVLVSRNGQESTHPSIMISDTNGTALQIGKIESDLPFVIERVSTDRKSELEFKLHVSVDAIDDNAKSGELQVLLKEPSRTIEIPVVIVTVENLQQSVNTTFDANVLGLNSKQ